MPEPLAGVILVDDGAGAFGPLCDLRPVYGLRTGVWTNGERLVAAAGAPLVGHRVPSPLAAIVRESTGLPTNELPAGDTFLLVNGRARSLPRPGLGEAAILPSGDVVAAHLTRQAAESYLHDGELPRGVHTSVTDTALLTHPWHILDGLADGIAADVRALCEDAERLGYLVLPESHPARMGTHPVLVHRTATIAPYVVFDASAGPIHVGERSVVRPFAVLCGPCSIGTGSTVGDRALIKPNTTCGPQCRLGGEIGGTSIVGYSNKTHDGHLGDSVVGEWVNLGAGTDNSNLLNTYGEVPVRLEPEGPRQRSGRIFLGAIIGDHVKAAIGTRIMTGTVIGTGAMIASTSPPPSIVRRFAWLTDEGERRYALPKFIEVMTAVFARRGLTPGRAAIARIAELHGQLHTQMEEGS